MRKGEIRWQSKLVKERPPINKTNKIKSKSEAKPCPATQSSLFKISQTAAWIRAQKQEKDIKYPQNGEARIAMNSSDGQWRDETVIYKSLPEVLCALEAHRFLVLPLPLHLLPVALLLVDDLLDQSVEQRLGLLDDIDAHGVVDIHLRNFGPNQVVALLLVALNCRQSLRAPYLAFLLVEGDHGLREGIFDSAVVDLSDSGRPGKARDGVVDFDDDVVAVVVHGLDKRGKPALSHAALLLLSVGQVAALDLRALQLEQLHFVLSLLFLKGRFVEDGRGVD